MEVSLVSSILVPRCRRPPVCVSASFVLCFGNQSRIHRSELLNNCWQLVYSVSGKFKSVAWCLSFIMQWCSLMMHDCIFQLGFNSVGAAAASLCDSMFFLVPRLCRLWSWTTFISSTRCAQFAVKLSDAHYSTQYSIKVSQIPPLNSHFHLQSGKCFAGKSPSAWIAYLWGMQIARLHSCTRTHTPCIKRRSRGISNVFMS